PYRPSGDRPAQRPAQSGDRPPYRPSGDKPAQSGDRPPYRPSGDRPAQSGDRPPYRPSGDRPPYRPSGDRPAQRPAQSGDRPPYRPSGDRPPYRQDSNRPPYRGNDNKPEIKTPVIAKPAGIDKRTDKEKEKDKFAKLEKGKTKKPSFVRNLEKATKPKKHISRPKFEEEPEVNVEELPEGTIIVNVPITVAGFCEQAEITTTSVIMKLMKLGIMANINQSIDEDTVLVLAEELGLNVVIGRVSEDIVEEGIEIFEDKEAELKPRPPIITVMGHVDHGKTSLLDAIRKTNVTESESGGITQHIGASEVVINGHKIVFLDTPGHEAFTAMRARGAHVTDVAVLVVAADDSVKPQTIESISHAKAAGVPVIVAVNKMDKPAADLDKVKKDLSTHGILVEEWGGDTICVPVSAKTGEGIVTLLEMILLQAEIMELKANPNRLASGTVIEARIDKARGTVATLLVLNGTLHSGDSIVAGTNSGKIKLMVNHLGETIKKAGPATAVEILGLSDVPEAGDVFNAVKEDKMAREIAESRKTKLREEVFARNSSTTLEQLFSQLLEGEVKELNLIIKGDVQGSVGALESSLEKMKNENVRVKVLHSGVGTVTESDVMLAGTSGAIIIGFNVRPSTAVSQIAEREGVEIRTYRVIYNVIDEIEAAIKGMLDPIFKEVILGKVEIRETFKVPGIGLIAGAYVTEGKVVRNAEIRLVRDGIVIHEGKISSLKRFKDDAKEVAKGFECGIGIENFNDVKEGDLIECFQMEEIERK
ncbi:MAG: translation initiation factor IF-2, partial [Peptostreptococcaceae bacterium]|nr:translation initiation factor IF-2 [Peptostreptococcaceae bacterium]